MYKTIAPEAAVIDSFNQLDETLRDHNRSEVNRYLSLLLVFDDSGDSETAEYIFNTFRGDR